MNLKELIGDIYPLSPMQEGMLFHTLYAPGSGMYFLQTRCRLAGRVEGDLLAAAWRRAVERHPILRSAFLWENLEKPVQVVYRRAEPSFASEDWRGLPEAEAESRVRGFLAADRTRGFDLSSPPLLRLTLLRLAEERWEMVWSYHHLLLDAWSGPLLLGEVFADYAAALTGSELKPPPRRPFRDYIAWLKRRDPGRSEAFWRRHLEGMSGPTPIPADRPARGEPAAASACRRMTAGLPAADSALLRALARRCRVTLGVILESAWALLLGRYARSEQAVFGLVVSGRPADLPGAEAMIGLFINTLPLCVRWDGARTPGKLYSRLQAEQAGLHAHEDSPLATVQGWSGVPRGLPLFESLLVVANYPAPSATLGPGFTLEWAETRERTGYPLTLEVRSEEVLQLQLDSELSRFDPTTAERLLAQLVHLLRQMAADPQVPPGELPLAGVAERHQLLLEWNDTAVVYAPDASLTGLLAAQAARSPEAVALRFEGGEMRYRDLDAAAECLALRLAEQGVGRGWLVGVLAPRSPELVVAFLGALKAGAAYLPLDPESPPERLAQMVGEARRAAPTLLLLHDALALGAAALPTGVTAVPLSRQTLAASGPARGTRADIFPDDLAYVIFTSGSTGRPKGVMNTDGGIVNRLLWMQQTYRLTPADRVLQKTPATFDVSAWELFWPLLAGATLVLARPGGQREPDYLARTIVAEGITTLHFVPSMLEAFVAEPGVERCRESRLARVIVSGEALSPALAERFGQKLGPAVELHNLYGPTEAAVDVTAWRCRPEGGRAAVAIGRPIANTRIHLLDEGLTPCPIGAPGELFIGGVQVAQGYLGRPELTAASFVPDPFASLPGARLYRTGDLARHLPGGEIDFLGRRDFQVKVRGVRIEPAEIESALLAHPAVARAVVIVWQPEGDEARLVAYYVPADRAAAGTPPGELREHLRARLPESMIPGSFVPLAALPLNASGKLDRRALPPPEMARTAPVSFAAPASDLERRIAEVWSWALGVSPIGIRDNFFDLGGHSLLMIKAVGRLRQETGLPLSLVEAFRYPTVAQLAAHLNDAGTAGPSPVERGRQAGAEAGRGRQRMEERRQRQSDALRGRERRG